MGRGYTRETYLALIERVKAAIPGVSISSDFISGFCGETEAEHRETITLMEQVRYDQVSKCDGALCNLSHPQFTSHPRTPRTHRLLFLHVREMCD